MGGGALARVGRGEAASWKDEARQQAVEEVGEEGER